MGDMTRKIKFACSSCGSDDVRVDAYAEWNASKQEWVLASTFDQAHCEKCEGECSIDDVELTEEDATS